MPCACPGLQLLQLGLLQLPVPKGLLQPCLNGSLCIKVLLTPISPNHQQTPLNLHVDKCPELGFSFVAN